MLIDIKKFKLIDIFEYNNNLNKNEWKYYNEKNEEMYWNVFDQQIKAENI